MPQVRILSSRPRRRGLCIVRDDFSFEKSSAHSRRRSSFPQKVTLATNFLRVQLYLRLLRWHLFCYIFTNFDRKQRFCPHFRSIFCVFSSIETPLLENQYFYDHLSNEVCEKYFSLITAAQILTVIISLYSFSTPQISFCFPRFYLAALPLPKARESCFDLTNTIRCCTIIHGYKVLCAFPK